MPAPIRLARLSVAVTALLFLLGAAIAHAQATPPAWVSIDGSPPDTPASFTLDATASSPEHSMFDLVVHGFWMTPRLGDDGLTYQQISVPNLPSVNEYGAPELPLLRIALGIVTGSPLVTLASAVVLGQSTYSGILPWPHPLGALPDTIPTPERFVRTDSYYTSRLDYPSGSGTPASAVEPLTGGLNDAVCEAYPFHWNSSGTLTVNHHLRLTYDHPGVPVVVEAGSPSAAKAALGVIANAGAVDPYLTWNHLKHLGYFLFVCPSGYEPALTPLIDQKKKRGFDVTLVYLDALRRSVVGEEQCQPIREAIDAWYAGTPHAADHFALLVGETPQIPVCNYPMLPGNGLGVDYMPTDDKYGDADGNGVDDMAKEVYVGRLSIYDEADLKSQVARILAYEDTPSPFESFDRAALIAWNSHSDSRFITALNKVQAASYASVTPSFDLVDGGSLTVHNSSISTVAATDGIVAYDGHGSPEEWWAWNRETLSYSNTHVDALINAPVTPVIWSLACYTGLITTTNCFGEDWMRQDADGAVAFYGATGESWIWDNGIMAQRLFDAVFNQGITTHGIAIAFTEFATYLATGELDNPIEYLLLGDPEMHIRRANVSGSPPYIIQIPPFVVAGPVRPVDPHVRLPNGRPAVGVKVALWKKAAPGAATRSTVTAADEVLDNRYTDSNGDAHFDLTGLTPGTLFVTVVDEDANVLADSIAVTDGSASVDPSAGPARLRVAESVAQGSVRFLVTGSLEHDTRLSLYDVAGRLVRTLPVGRGTRSITWDGTGSAGSRVPAGLYLARLQAPANGIVRVVLLH